MSKATKAEPKNVPVKVILRRLPRRMTKAEILEQISPLPEEVEDYYFMPANLSFDHHAFSSLYLIFSSYCDALFEFEKQFDGYIFVDSKGNDSAAVVEVALNQEFVKRDTLAAKNDSRCGAIKSDTYFKEFVAKMEQDDSAPILTLEQQLLRLGRSEDAKTQIDRLETPLVKHMFDQEFAKRKNDIARRTKREEKWKQATAAKISENGKKKEEKAASSKPAEKPLRNESNKKPAKIENVKTAREPDEARNPESNGRRAKNKEYDDKKKERDAARLKSYQNKKKEAAAVKKGEENGKPSRAGKHSRLIRPNREGTTTLGERVGNDWIKKLTDPKSNIKSSFDATSGATS